MSASKGKLYPPTCMPRGELIFSYSRCIAQIRSKDEIIVTLETYAHADEIQK